MKTYFIRPYSAQYQDVTNVVLSTASKLGASSVVLSDAGKNSDSFLAEVAKQVQEADLIIADITGPDSHVLLELGLATGIRKPCILICQQDTPIATDLSKYLIFL